jgi:hypothetical protein
LLLLCFLCAENNKKSHIGTRRKEYGLVGLSNISPGRYGEV